MADDTGSRPRSFYDWAGGDKVLVRLIDCCYEWRGGGLSDGVRPRP